MIQSLTWFNVALRALMEFGIVVALGYWGYMTGDTTAMKILLAIGAPLLGFGIWSLVDFRWAGALAEPLRLIEELVISAIAVLALYVVGAHTWAWALALLSIAHHALVYISGERLLKQRDNAAKRRATRQEG